MQSKPLHRNLADNKPAWQGKSAEMELLIRCGSYCVRQHKDTFGPIDPQRIDRKRLLWLSRRHGMLPHLYWCLPELRKSDLPFHVAQDVYREFTAVATRNVDMAAELLFLLDLFESASIPAVAWKGPSLAAILYGSFLRREYRDIDILVPRDQVCQAAQLMISQGYRPESPRISTDRGHHFGLFRAGVALRVELHWKLSENRILSTEYAALCRRIQTRTIGTRKIAVPALADMILPLCLHGANDMWNRLALVCDFARLVEMLSVDEFESSWEEAAKGGIRRTLSVALRLAYTLTQCRFPRQICMEIERDAVAIEMARTHECELNRYFTNEDFMYGDLFRILYHDLSSQRFRDRIRPYREAIWQYKWRTPRLIDRDLLGRFAFLYFFLPPLKVLGKYVLSPARSALRRSSVWLARTLRIRTVSKL